VAIAIAFFFSATPATKRTFVAFFFSITPTTEEVVTAFFFSTTLATKEDAIAFFFTTPPQKKVMKALPLSSSSFRYNTTKEEGDASKLLSPFFPFQTQKKGDNNLLPSPSLLQ
jgi:hypothetical protein